MVRVFYPREPQDEANDRELRDYTNSLLAKEEAREDQSVNGSHPCTTYRPDETDDLNDMAIERDWEVSADEYERFMGRLG